MLNLALLLVEFEIDIPGISKKYPLFTKQGNKAIKHREFLEFIATFVDLQLKIRPVGGGGT